MRADDIQSSSRDWNVVDHADDYVPLRARAGYVMGNFLPYGFVGFAIGSADIIKDHDHV